MNRLQKGLNNESTTVVKGHTPSSLSICSCLAPPTQVGAEKLLFREDTGISRREIFNARYSLKIPQSDHLDLTSPALNYTPD